jgi:hypothetical protein
MGNLIDSDFRQGDSVTVEVSNKPFVDFEIPAESNDYRWCDFSNIKIYCPPDNVDNNNVNLIDLPPTEIVYDGPLKINPARVGWYFFRYSIPCDAPVGLWKIEVTLSSFVPIGTSTDSTTVCTTGSPITGTPTTGSPSITGAPDGYELVSAVSVHFFRVMRKEIY